MPSLADVNHDAGLFCMFKGEPGTRKSTQALSFPGPQYWISTDQKMEALILPAKEWGIQPNHVDYDDYSKYDPIKMKLYQLKLNCDYKTIVLDSVTTTGDVINLQTINMKTGTTTVDGAEKGMKIGGIRVNSLEDYKAEAAAFQDTLAALKDIHKFHKVNIIIIAHVVGERKKEEIGVTAQSRIIITGGKAISGKISAYCTEVYHFDIQTEFDVEKEGKYGLLTVHTGVDYARTSLPLPRRITFDNKPLYATHLKPAIEKLNQTSTLTSF